MSRSLRSAMAVAAALGFGTLAGNGAAPHAGPPGEIVFVSDRASANPGEVYLLAAGVQPRDVSRSPAADKLPATAPDGRIAFWRTVGSRSPGADDSGCSSLVGRCSLFIANAEGSGLRRLLTTTDVPVASWFSPDGSKLLVWENVGIGFAPMTIVVDVVTGAVTVAPRACLAQGWSPDGTRIACAANHRILLLTLDGRVVRTLAGTSVLWVARDRLAVLLRNGRTELVDDHGKVLRHLFGNPVAASPDGRFLALARPGALILVSGRTGGGIRSLTGPHEWIPGGKFSPDSRELAYNAPPEGSYRSLPVAGGASRRLPAFGIWTRDGHYAFIRVAPDGRYADIMIGDRHGLRARRAGHFPFDEHGDSSLLPGAAERVVYSTSARSHRDLWSIAPDGTSLRRLTSDGNDVRDPAWSTDGTRLAFAEAPFSPGMCGFCGSRVVLATPSGRPVATLPSSDFFDDASPTWAPDAHSLALVHGPQADIKEIDVVDVDGGNRHQIVAEGGLAPAWSPDGKTIAFDAADGIHLRTPDGNNDRLIVAGASSPAWSNDSGQLAYVRDGTIYVAPAALPAQGRQIARGREPSFSPSGDSLAFAGRNGIFVVDVDGTGLRRLTSMPGCAGCYYDASPAWRPSR